MPTLSRLQKYTIIAVGTVSGAGLFYYNVYGNREEVAHVANSWTTDFIPSVRWDCNWDRRDPKSLVKPIKGHSEEAQNKYNEQLEQQKAKATRHLLLIRHGQYNLKGTNDAERYLTELGRRQADFTGKRLAELTIPFSLIVRSTMTRAQETSKIIEKSLSGIPTEDDVLLMEGAPIPPEPPIGHWKSDWHFFQDGPRIEAAFRKYFHRATPQQTKDSYTLLVCHANIIRYFVCRALQFPPEAWLRLSLKHASITWITIHPNGRVSLRCFGDSGHIPPDAITTNS
ncbi:serine/threonine-protein phosphatase Pgam5, mitochondrial [Diachasma alloeum]|uniref:serine/threonine-protein phosphatase Pgam5, mitochondrial n=1 Tax=Diachasma alloeum TaxID=454923 RepID=UPI00073822CC|nr:serine/threonine-protein phosphatase Pgam5, mitochondrial [Diachasma alloeum]